MLCYGQHTVDASDIHYISSLCQPVFLVLLLPSAVYIFSSVITCDLITWNKIIPLKPHMPKNFELTLDVKSIHLSIQYVQYVYSSEDYDLVYFRYNGNSIRVNIYRGSCNVYPDTPTVFNLLSWLCFLP